MEKREDAYQKAIADITAISDLARKGEFDKAFEIMSADWEAYQKAAGHAPQEERSSDGVCMAYERMAGTYLKDARNPILKAEFQALEDSLKSYRTGKPVHQKARA